MYQKLKELLINAGIQVDPDPQTPLSFTEYVQAKHFLYFQGKKVEDFIIDQPNPTVEAEPSPPTGVQELQAAPESAASEEVPDTPDELPVSTPEQQDEDQTAQQDSHEDA